MPGGKLLIKKGNDTRIWGEGMKALSIRQPWAWLICTGFKDVENRTWHIHNKLAVSPLIRVYVHASKGIDNDAWNFLRHLVTEEIWKVICSPEFYETLARGAIIGEVDIVGCKYRFGEENDNLYSPWHEVGMYGLLLANPVLYDKPIPCKGKLGFFEPDISIPSG